jgi:hypothetical protein
LDRFRAALQNKIRASHVPGSKACPINGFQHTSRKIVLTKARQAGELPNKELVTCCLAARRGTQSTVIPAMPRYFFNTRIDRELILDPEGEELRDPDHAWNVARTTIREILKTEGGEASLLNAILEVTDDDGEIVLEFPFAEAIIDNSENSETKH